MALLEIDGLSHSFGARRVLDRISLDVEEGECLALLGRTGTGKTTLLSLLAGLLTADAGVVRLNGKVLTGPGLDRGVVFQHESLLPWLTAKSNVALAVEAAFPEDSPDRQARRVAAVLALVKLDHAAELRPAALSGGMRQRVALARALAMEPQVLLMDEPFSAVDALTRAGLQQELIRIRRETSRTIVIVTSDLDEALFLGDRVVVLRADGTLSEPIRPPSRLARDRGDGETNALRERLGRLLGAPDEDLPTRSHVRAPVESGARPALLEFKAVAKRFSSRTDDPPVVENVDLILCEREFLSIIGHSGCGKSTLLSMAAGLVRPSAGEILIDGSPVTGPGAERAMVFQSPALPPWLTVEENVRLGVDQAFGDRRRAERRRIVAQALERLGLSDVAASLPRELSAGARQRVGVARAIALSPRALLLDEPFAGLDDLTRRGLQSVLADLCRDTGTAAILVTHDIDEALALSDRIALMTDGPRARIGRVLETADTDPAQARHEILQFLGETTRARAWPLCMGPAANFVGLTGCL